MVFARRLEVVAVAALMWVSWCPFGGAGFFLVFQVTNLFFFQKRARVNGRWLRETQTAVSVDSVKGIWQLANLPTENSRANLSPHQVYRLLCSHLRNMASSLDH